VTLLRRKGFLRLEPVRPHLGSENAGQKLVEGLPRWATEVDAASERPNADTLMDAPAFMIVGFLVFVACRRMTPRPRTPPPLACNRWTRQRQE
jgi:hypothetical protein